VTATPLGPPAAPTGLVAASAPAAGVGSGEVKLTWSAPDNGGSAITDYLIQSSTDGVTWTTVDDGVSTVPAFNAQGLTNGTAYWFRVAATNAFGTGSSSAIATATPAWKPAAPAGLTTAVAPTSGVSSGQVKLTWTTTAGNGAAITDYLIQRSTDGVTWTTLADGVSPTPAFTAGGLTNGKAYRFRVAAVNAVGSGSWSASVTAVPRWKPAAPGGLRAVAGARRVTLTWNAPASNGAAITDYVIQRSPDGKRWTTVRDGVSTARSSIVTGLTNGVAYRFRVAAKNAVGVGPWSLTVRATPRAG
jgi:titin